MNAQKVKQKIKSFIDNNFPEPYGYKIIQSDEINYIYKIELNYIQEKILITIGLDTTTSSLFKLIDTKFIS